MRLESLTFALAEQYRNDPVAVDALISIVEKSTAYADRPDGPMFDRAIETLLAEAAGR